MKIHEIIQQEKSYAKNLGKYSNPMIARYRDFIPEKIRDKFYAQASIEEIALYWFGHVGIHWTEFPGVLLSLQERKNVVIPDVYGITSVEFWRKWHLNHVVEIMDQGKIFGK